MKKPARKVAPPVPQQPIASKAAPVKIRRGPVALAFAILAFLLYANTLGHQFTVDDGTVISNNKITKKGISAIPEIFTTSYRAGFWERSEGLYRPLSVAMFAIEYELAPENPAPGHWINVILYALTAALLFYLLSELFQKYSIMVPIVAALLFVIHPLHTEVVANIKSRDELLAFLFSVLTLYAYMQFLRQRKTLHQVLSAVWFFLAYLSKESALTLLPIIPLTGWFFTNEKPLALLKQLSVYAGVTALYFIIRIQVLGGMTGTAELQLINNSILGASNFSDRLATAFAVMGKYLWLLFIPHPLSFDYSYNQVQVVSFSSPTAFIPLLLCLFLAWIAIKGFSKKDPVTYGILFFAITISLVSNILFLIESTMAERFLFTPSLGFCIAIGFLLAKYFKLVQPASIHKLTEIFTAKPVFTIVLSVVFVLYGFKTISRNTDWKDNITLLSKDVRTCPNSARIRYAYGSALLVEKALKEENEQSKSGYLDKSIAELQRGVEILPNYAEAWKNLGMAYKEKSNPTAAIAAFEKARSYKTFSDFDFYIASGLAYGMGKQYDKAIADLNKAIELDPKNPEAFNNKGLYLTEMGKPDSALKYLDEAIKLKPGFHQAYYNKGNTLAQMQDFEGAIKQYLLALEAKPGYVDAWLNMGNSYAAMKRFGEALPWFLKVDSVQPNNFKAVVNLGITYQMLGDTVNSNRYFNQARSLEGRR